MGCFGPGDPKTTEPETTMSDDNFPNADPGATTSNFSIRVDAEEQSDLPPNSSSLAPMQNAMTNPASLAPASPLLSQKYSSNIAPPLEGPMDPPPIGNTSSKIISIKDTPKVLGESQKFYDFERRRNSFHLDPDLFLPRIEPSKNRIVKHWQEIIHDLNGQLITLQVQSDRLGPLKKAKNLVKIEDLRRKIRIYSQYIEDEPKNHCCAIFIAETVHSLCVLILTVLTFPWNLPMFCFPKAKNNRAIQGLVKLLLAFSLLINMFILFVPHYTTGPSFLTSYDVHEDSVQMWERCLTVVAVMWALINMQVFSCFCGPGPAIQQAFVDFCGVSGPSRIMREEMYDEYDSYFRLFTACGLSESNFFFLRLSSTLALLISITAGLAVGFGFQIARVYSDYPPVLIISFVGGGIAIWFVIMRIICHSLISTFGSYSLQSMGSPLLTKSNDNSDNTSQADNTSHLGESIGPP